MTEEHTSAEVASIAAHMLALSDQDLIFYCRDAPNLVRKVAASALTQARDRAQPVDTSVGDREPVGGDPPDV